MISKFVILFLLGVFALASLFVAAGGQGFQYWSGLGFFVVCILLAFYAVHEMTGNHDDKAQNKH
jgi:protein-S-isoprenylcysteine O-methyltransferase Ste14